MFGELDDEQRLDLLAARVAQGDHVAFELVYEQMVDGIYGYLHAQTGDSMRAEELTSNVFIKAWSAARAYRAGSGKYRHWLFAIARNELRDSFRRQKSTREHPLADVLRNRSEDETPNGPDSETTSRLAKAMSALSDEQRQVVILRFFSEQSHAEIARILRKREGAVRAQLLRALRHMRKVMDSAAT